MKIKHKDPQKRLDDFSAEYEVKFSHYMWRHHSGELKHRVNAMGTMGTGLSIIGDWCDSFAEAVDQIFSKIEEE